MNKAINTIFALLVTAALSDSGRVFSDDSVEQVIYRHTSSHQPLLRGISTDGKFIAHTAAIVHRNAAGEGEFYRRWGEGLTGQTWTTGLVQAIRATSDGQVKLFISQYRPETDGRALFNKPLRSDIENALFGTSNIPVARFPNVDSINSVGNGSIQSTCFGKAGRLLVFVAKEREEYELVELEIATGKMTDRFSIGRGAPTRDWTSPQTDMFLSREMDLYKLE